MRLQRRMADFLIRNCGLGRLHSTGVQSGIRAFLDEIDFQHLRDSHPCRSCVSREEMYQYLNSEVIGGAAVDFLEFGVYRGESIREWARLNQHEQSRFFGFDSFAGLPETWRAAQGKGHFDVGGNTPQIDDDRVVFLKGWFDETVPSFARDFVPRNQMVVHLDADLYGSTMVPLMYLMPSLVAGSVLIFDEFYDRNHEFKAFHDYLTISKRSYRACCEMKNYARFCVQLQ